MTASLANQPLDIILLIVDIGELGSSDAIALRSVCRSLYHTSEDRSFWLNVANNVQRRHPLPLPPFRPMPSLSAEKLRMACVRHAVTSVNLRSSKPQRRGSRIFIVEGEHGPVTNVAILYGGRYGLTMQDKGTLCIWDLHSVLSRDVTSASARDALPDAKYNPQPVGTLLASIDTKFTIRSLDYRIFGPEEKQVVVTTTSTSIEGECVLSVFEFNFISDYEVITHQHYQTVAPMIAPMATLGTYGFAIFFCNQSEVEEEPTRLLVVNFVQGQSQLIRARGVPPNYSFGYDMIATDTGDLLLYMATNRTLKISAYFDIMRLIGSQPEPITLDPDSTETFVYSETCKFPSRPEGNIVHPWNTPSIRTLHQLPVLTAMTTSSSFEGLIDWTFSAHWLNPDSLLAYMKSHATDIKTDFRRPIHRKFHHVDGQIPLSAEGRELSAFGDSGRNVIWIGEPVSFRPNPSRSLYLLPLHSPTDNPTPEEGLNLYEGLRKLVLPISLDRATLVDFCDASGIAMVVNDGMTRGGKHQQCIHFFQY